MLERLEEIVDQRLRDRPPGSYTARLAEGGLPLVARKVGEEAVETLVEALGGSRERLVEEAADLLYHLIVMLRLRGVSVREVLGELGRRMG